MYGLHDFVPLSKKDKTVQTFKAEKFNKAIEHLHVKKGLTSGILKDEPVVDLINETARVLNDAVDTALMDAEVPEEMTAKLRDDVFIFSGCKTYHELKEASQMLLDETGRIKPLHKFVEDVREIHPKYNEQYLGAEHNFAVTSAQSAAQWAAWEEDGDDYDLQYCTALDNDVRPEHAALEGITLPVSDNFWLSYMTPNGWKCRCTVKQVRKGKYSESDHDKAIRLGEQATTSLDNNGRNRAEMFRFNPGAQGVVFPPNHPYYRNVPAEAKKLSGYE